ncbi:hypothetical protein J6590_036578 [Homalodisca vitripennis]|nr:hypothetical protein J6590_036578 [Homalodisca vitripennis]
MRILTKICSDEYVRNPRRNQAVTVCAFSDLLMISTCQSRPAKWMNSMNNIFLKAPPASKRQRLLEVHLWRMSNQPDWEQPFLNSWQKPA